MGFDGFSTDTLDFLSALADNNDREWFASQRDRYQASVVAPARAFVTDLGEALRPLAPQIQAIPKFNKSIFRFNRDTRFSADKAPFKTHLGIFLWEGTGKRLETSGFYVHVEPSKLLLGVGLYQFPKDVLHRYREAAADDASGALLAASVEQVATLGYDLTGDTYKRVPRGFERDHPREALLRRKGLTAFWEGPLPKSVTGAGFVDTCLTHFKKMAPLHVWLREHVLSNT